MFRKSKVAVLSQTKTLADARLQGNAEDTQKYCITAQENEKESVKQRTKKREQNTYDPKGNSWKRNWIGLKSFPIDIETDENVLV